MIMRSAKRDISIYKNWATLINKFLVDLKFRNLKKGNEPLPQSLIISNLFIFATQPHRP